MANNNPSVQGLVNQGLLPKSPIFSPGEAQLFDIDFQSYRSRGVAPHPSTRSYWDYYRWRNQPQVDQIGNWFMQSVIGEIIGGSIHSVGSSIELPISVMESINGESSDFNNAITDLGQGLMDWSKKEFPIYRRDPQKTFDWGDLGWWTEHGVSVASSLGMMIPAMGFSKGLTVLGKAAGLLDKVGKTGRVVQAGMLGKSAEFWTNAISMPMFMRNAENFRESADVVNRSMDESLAILTAMDDPTYKAWIGSEVGMEVTGGAPISRRESAERIASMAGWRTYRDDAVNVIFDFIQVLPMLRGLYPRANVTRLASKRIVTEQVESIGGETAIKSLTSKGLNRLAMFGYEPITEAMEETVNAIATNEGMHYGRYLLNEADDNTFGDRFEEYMKDPATWEQAFWGFMGGLTFAAGQRAVIGLGLSPGMSVQALEDKQSREISSREASLSIYGGFNEIINRGENPYQKEKSGKGLTDEYLPIGGTPEQQEEYKATLRKRTNFDLATVMSTAAARAGTFNLLLEFLNSPGLIEKVKEQPGTVDEATAIASLAEIKGYVTQFKNAFKRNNESLKAKNYPDWAKNTIAIENAAQEGEIERITKDINIINGELATLKSADQKYKNIVENLDETTTIEDVEDAINIAALEEVTMAMETFANTQASDIDKIKWAMSTAKFRDFHHKYVNLKSKVDISSINPNIITAAGKILSRQSVINNRETNLADEEGRIKVQEAVMEKIAMSLDEQAIADLDPVIDETINVATNIEMLKNAEKEALSVVDKTEKLKGKGRVLKSKNKIIKHIKDRFKIAKGNLEEQLRRDKVDEEISKATVAKQTTEDYEESVRILEEDINKLEEEGKTDTQEYNDYVEELRNLSKSTEVSEDIAKAVTTKVANIEHMLAQRARDKQIYRSKINKKDPIKSLKQARETEGISPYEASILDELIREEQIRIDEYDAPDSETRKLRLLIDDAYNDLSKGKSKAQLLAKKTVEDEVALRALSMFSKYFNFSGVVDIDFADILDYVYREGKQGEAYTRRAAEALKPKFNYLKSIGRIGSKSIIDPHKSSEQYADETIERVDNETEDLLADTIEKTGGEHATSVRMDVFTDTNIIRKGGDIVISDNIDAINIILNELHEGSEITLKVDTEHELYDKSANLNNVPIAVYYGDTKLNISLAPVPFLEEEFSVITELSSSSINTSKLRTIYNNLQSYLAGHNADAVFKRLSGNETLASKYLYRLFDIDPTSATHLEEFRRYLNHLAYVLFFKQDVRGGPIKWNLDLVRKQLMSWQAKLSRQLDNNVAIRNWIGSDPTAELKTKISYMSQGNIIISRESDEVDVSKGGVKLTATKTGKLKRKYRLLNETINDDINKIQLLDVKKNTRNTQGLFMELESIDGSDMVRAIRKAEGYESKFGFVSVPVAGNNNPVPTPIRRNSVGQEFNVDNEYYGKLEDKVYELISNILGKIISLKKSKESQILNNTELRKIINHLNEIIYVQDVTTTQDGVREQIPLTHFQVHNNGIQLKYKDEFGTVQTIKIEVASDKAVSYSIKFEDKSKSNINNVKDEESFKKNLKTFIKGLRLNVINSKVLEVGSYTDPVDSSVTHDSYKHFIINRGFIFTDVGKMVDNEGNKISNVTGKLQDNNMGFGRGSSLVMNVDSTPAKEKKREYMPVSLSNQYTSNTRYEFMYNAARKLGYTFVHEKKIDPGHYAETSPTEKTITLFKTWHELTNDQQKETLVIHEIIHAALNEAINNPKFKARLNKFRNTLNASFNSIDKNGNPIKSVAHKIADKYGISIDSYGEFIRLINEEDGYKEIAPYVLSDPAIATILQHLQSKAKGKEDQSMWADLRDIIVEMIQSVVGKFSKLDELVSILDEFTELSVPKESTVVEDVGEISEEVKIERSSKEDLLNKGDNVVREAPPSDLELNFATLLAEKIDPIQPYEEITKRPKVNYAKVVLDFIPVRSIVHGDFNYDEINNWTGLINRKFYTQSKAIEHLTREDIRNEEQASIKNRILMDVRNSLVTYIHTKLGDNINILGVAKVYNRIYDTLVVELNDRYIPIISSINPDLIPFLQTTLYKDISEIASYMEGGAKVFNTAKGILELETKDSALWQEAKNELSRTGVTITDLDEILDKIESATDSWREDKHFTIKIKDTISSEIKAQIFSQPLLSDESTYNKETNTLTKVYAKSPTIFPNYLNASTLNTLSNLFADVASIDEMRDRLYDFSTRNPSVVELWKGLNVEDENMRLAWYSHFSKRFPPKVIEKFVVYAAKVKGKIVPTVGMAEDIENNVLHPATIKAREWTSKIEQNIFNDVYDNAFTIRMAKDLSVINTLIRSISTKSNAISVLMHEFYNKLGINISAEVILREIESSTNFKEYEATSKIKNPNDGEVKAAIFIDKFSTTANNVLRTVIDLNEDRSIAYDNNQIKKLAKIAAKYEISSELRYANVKSNSVSSILEANPTLDTRAKLKSNHPTSMASVADEFIEMAHAPGMHYSNLLWNHTPKEPTGFFNIQNTPSDPNDSFNRPGRTVKPDTDKRTIFNKKFLDNFDISVHAGNKNLNSVLGNEYDDITHEDWILTCILKHLQYADGANNRALARNRNNKNGIVVPSINLADRTYTYLFNLAKVALDKDNFKFTTDKAGNKSYKIDRSSPIWQAVYRTFLQEVDRIDKNLRMVFVVEDGKLVTDDKGHYIVKDRTSPDFKEPQLYKHYTLDDQGNRVFMDSEGNLTGRGFQFHNIKYIVDGKQITTNDIIGLDEGSADPGLIKNTVPLGTVNKNIFTTPTTNIANHIDAYIQYLVDDAVERTEQFREVLQPKISKDSFELNIAEFILNNYIYNIEFQNIFFGHPSEFKNNEAVGKQAKVAVSSGRKNALSGIFKGVTLFDIHLESSTIDNISDILAKDIRKRKSIKQSVKYDINKLRRVRKGTLAKNALNELEIPLYNIVSPYLRIETTDGQSFISVDEFIRRIRGFGEYTKYKEIIDRLESGKTLDPSQIAKVIQVQKNVYFRRAFDSNLGDIRTNIVKNSEIVLLPQLIKDKDLQELNRLMKQHHVGQVNFVSGEKVGTKGVVRLHDDDGRIIKDMDQEFSDAANIYHYENLYRQQEVRDHMKDTWNKAGIQIMKVVQNYINLESDKKAYTVGTTPVTGRELFNHFNEVYVYNIEESSIELMREFVELDEKGNIQNDEYGDPIVSSKKVVEKLLTEAVNRTASNNSKLALEYDENIDNTTIPLSFNTLRKHWISYITSFHTNNVTNQKLPGSHTTLVSTAFQRSISGGKKASQLTQTAQGVGGERLKGMRIEDGQVLPAQIYLPAWSKAFFTKKGKRVSLDSIPVELRRMIMYRIPTEDQHSMMYVEVVDFLPEAGGSYIVLPDEIIPQTGTDFDLDTAYMIHKNFRRTIGGKIVPIEYMDENTTVEQRAVEFGMAKSKKDYESDDFWNYLEETLPTAKYRNINKKYVAITNEHLDRINNYILNRDDTLDTDFLAELNAARYKTETDDTKVINDLVVEMHADETVNTEILRIDTEALAALKSVLTKYNTHIKRNDIEAWTKELKDKPILEQNSRRARENRLFDSMIAVMTNQDHLAKIFTPSGYSHIVESKELVEKDVIPPNNATFFGQIELRIRNIDGVHLKATSVLRDVFLSVASATGIELAESHGIRIKYSDKYNNKKVAARFGKDNVTNDNIVTHTTVGNNVAKDFLNIDDEYILAYSSETTALILDISKTSNPPNVNRFTFPIWKLFPDIGSNFNTGTLFINQPIIRDLSANQSILSRQSLLGTGANPINHTRQIWLGKLFKAVEKSRSTKGTKFKYISDTIDKTGKLLVKKSNRKLIYKDIGYIEDTIPILDTEDLANTLQEQDTPAYYRVQLELLNLFEQMREITDEIELMIRAIRTDKFGPGPNFNTTDRIENAIDKLATENEEHSPLLFLSGSPAIKSIYPKHFGIETPSMYPMFEAFLNHSNQAAIKAFGKYFVERSKEYIYAIKKITNETYADSLSDRMITYLNNYLIDNLEYFRNSNISQTQISPNTINDPTDGEVYDPVMEERRRILGIDTEYISELDILDTDNLAAFDKLSPANKIDLVKKNGEYSIALGAETDNSLFNYIETFTSRGEIRRFNRHRLVYRQNDREDHIVDRARTLWASSNPFIRSIINDIIAYSHINSGFGFGYITLSKVIPTEIFINKFDAIDNEHSGIDLAAHQHRAEADISTILSDSVIEELIDNFKRANSGNTQVVPVLYPAPVNNKYGKSAWKFNDRGYIVITDEQRLAEVSNVSDASIINLMVKSDNVIQFSLEDFESAHGKRKTQMTIVSNDEYRVGQIINIRGRRNQHLRAVIRGINDSQDRISTYIKDISKGRHDNIKDFVEDTSPENKKARDSWMRREGATSNVRKYIGKLRDAKVFDENKNVQIIQYEVNADYIKKSPHTVKESYVTLKRLYMPITDQYAYYPVSKLEPMEYGKVSVNPSNNVAISEQSFQDYILRFDTENATIDKASLKPGIAPTSTKSIDSSLSYFHKRYKTIIQMANSKYRHNKTIKNVSDQYLSKFKTDIEELSLIQLGEALAIDFKYNSDTVSWINRRLNDWENADMSEIINGEATIEKVDGSIKKVKKFTVFTNDLMYMSSFIRSIAEVGGLKLATNMERMRMSKIELEIDDVIYQLIELSKKVTNIQNRIDDIRRVYFRDTLTPYTTNPNIKEGLIDLFESTNDQNLSQMIIGTLSETHNPFVANVMKRVQTAHYNAGFEVEDFFTKMKKGFKKHFGRERDIDISFLIEKVAGDKTGRLITPHGTEYRDVLYDYDISIKNAEIQHGRNSKEHLALKWDKKLWMDENLQDRTRNGYKEALYRIERELDKTPAARTIIEDLNNDKWAITSLHKGEGTEVYSKEEIRTLEAIRRRKDVYKSTWDEFGVHRKKGEALAIANAMNKYYKDIVEFYKKHHTRAVSEKWNTINTEMKAKLSAKMYNEWFANNTEPKFDDDFWDGFRANQGILKNDKSGLAEAIQDQLKTYKINGIIDGRRVDKNPSLRREIKDYEEGKAADVKDKLYKFVPAKDKTEEYTEAYHNKLSRDKDIHTNATIGIVVQMNQILNKYRNEKGFADAIVSIEDIKKLNDLKQDLELVRNPFDKNGQPKEDAQALIEDKYGVWFVKNHIFTSDVEAYESARRKADHKGKEYLTEWDKLNTEIVWDADVIEDYHILLKRLANLTTIKKKDDGTVISRFIYQFLKRFEDANGEIDVTKLTKADDINLLWLRDNLRKTSHYGGKIEIKGAPEDINVLTLSDMNQEHYYMGKNKVKQFISGFDNVSTLIKARKDHVKSTEKSRDRDTIIKQIDDLVTAAPTGYYKLALMQSSARGFNYQKDGIDKLTGKEDKWFFDNHTLDRNGNIIPLAYWTKLVPKDETKLTTRPNNRLWGDVKPKAQVEINNKMVNVVDTEKSKARKWMKENVKFTETIAYTEERDQRANDLKSKHPKEAAEAAEWFEANHYLNAYTGEYSPIRSWTTITPVKEENIKATNPIDIWYNSKPKPNYSNDIEVDNNGTPLPNKYDSQYTNLTSKQKEQLTFIKEMFVELATMLDVHSMIDDGFISSLPIANKDKKLFDKVIKKAGLFGATKKESVVDEHGEPVHFLDIPFINKVRTMKPLGAAPYKRGESEAEYVKRVAEEAKKQGYDKITSLEDIRKIQREIYDTNVKYHGENISYDLAEFMPPFVKAAINYKYKKDLEAEMHLALAEIGKLRINRRTGKGVTFTNKILEKATGIEEIVTTEGKGSRLETQFKLWMKQIFYDYFESDEHLTAISRVLQNYTSARGMWLNYTGAFNNVAYGKAQMAIEGASGIFFNRSEGRAAEKAYWKSAWSYLSDIGKDESSTFEGAMIKYWGVLELQDEKSFATMEKYRSKIYKTLISTNSFFFMHHSGEHYMQNKALLAMLRSHRIVNGKILSLYDYATNKQVQALKSILSEEGIKELDKFIIDEEAKVKDKLSKRNYIKKFIVKLSKAQLDEYRKAKKQLDKAIKDEFETYGELNNAFQLKQGKIILREGIQLDKDELVNFKTKVVEVNHKIHGVYDKFSANIMQHYAIGRLAMQFRKWMWTAWTKRFGSRFWKSHWNEGRREWDKGSYASTGEFVGQPFTENFGKEARNAEEFGVFTAIGNLIKDYAKFSVNVKRHWHSLDDFEKANVKRAGMEMIMLAGILVLGNLLRGIREDEDKKKHQWSWINLALYAQSRLELEFRQFTPYGFINETRKLIRTPVAGQSSIEEIIKLTRFGLGYLNPFADEEKKIYQGGPYHGEVKAGVYLQRAVPVWNQYFKSMHLGNYYKMY